MILRMLLALALPLPFMLSGCHKKTEKPVHPVRGRVLVRGGPIKDCRVVFYPLDDPNDPERPEGYTDADGWFELAARRTEKGAAAGAYKVILIWRDRNPDPYADEAWRGPNKFGPKYGELATTELRAKVAPGENVLAPFDLK